VIGLSLELLLSIVGLTTFQVHTYLCTIYIRSTSFIYLMLYICILIRCYKYATIINIIILVDATKKSGQRLVGDVDYKEVSQVASYITPVPGGVGPMTVCMLMKNTVISAAKSLSAITGQKWDFTPLPLEIKEPVPR